MLRKVKEKRKAEGRDTNLNKTPTKTKRRKKNEKVASPVIDNEKDSAEGDTTAARTLEDDNYIDIDISGIGAEFPSEEDEEIMEMETLAIESSNNNASVDLRKNLNSREKNIGALSALARKQPSKVHDNAIPHSSSTDPLGNPVETTVQQGQGNLKGLEATLGLMQEFTVQKGLIDNTMSEEEIKSFLQYSRNNNPKTTEKTAMNQSLKTSAKEGNNKGINSIKSIPPMNSNSEVTVYSRAVKLMQDSDLSQQLDQFLSKARNNAVDCSGTQVKNTSTSSEELMDTSEEHPFIDSDNSPPSISEMVCLQMKPKDKIPEMMPNDHVSKLLRIQSEARLPCLKYQVRLT